MQPITCPEPSRRHTQKLLAGVSQLWSGSKLGDTAVIEGAARMVSAHSRRSPSTVKARPASSNAATTLSTYA